MESERKDSKLLISHSFHYLWSCPRCRCFSHEGTW